MERYNHQAIEPKWQAKWEEWEVNKCDGDSKNDNVYVLDMFPYPSGQGLHVGHPEGYTATDIYSRYLRYQGKNVLHPMGWDAFGLPAENYAIKTGTHPRETTEKNIRTFKKQIMSLGLSYDWSREVDTTDPNYFKWTQWIFLQLFHKGLAYEATVPINWCPSCKTGLANEEVVQGKCDRCQVEVEKKDMKQWLLKITEYADRLLDGLDKLDWPESIKSLQRNWIGRSEGAEVLFNIKDSDYSLNVFTTRPDTLFGATYMVVAPEHEIISKLKSNISNLKEVENYIKKAKNKSDLERTDLAKDLPASRPNTYYVYVVLCDDESMYIGQTQDMVKRWNEHLSGQGAKHTKIHKPQKVIHYEELNSREDAVKREKNLKTGFGRKWLKREFRAGRTRQAGKTGVEIKGVKAINPVNNKAIPIWVADYVLASYGTGAIMAVPAHDERDYEFAKQYDLEIIQVVDGSTSFTTGGGKDPSTELGTGELYSGDGVAVNSGEYNGLTTAEFKKKITEWLEKNNLGRAAINYKLRDWVFSRQRYWGEPIPLIHCDKCGVVPINEKELPLTLPEVEKYEPTGTGESPLAGIEDWVNVKCPKCGSPAKREVNTMPQWAGSSWYWLRFIDPDNKEAFADKNKLKHWLPVNVYVGGAEHAVLHLLYARFWNMVLYDLGYVPVAEPFQKLINQGLILGPDGEKMSKSRGNVVNPDDVINEYGADTLRMYEMFMGPLEDAKPWDTKGIVGVRRFLDKVCQLKADQSELKANEEILLHKTIKKVGEDIANFRFNTAISAMMILVNEVKTFDKDSLEKLLIILSPFAPHLTEELWSSFTKVSDDPKYKESIFKQEWPSYDKKLIVEDEFELVFQVNGKVRDKLEVKVGITQAEVEELVKNSERVQKWLDGNEPKKIIYIPNKLVNIVA